jgi:molybdopterin-guanine dinucleotide biosynthesis protein B
VDGRPQPGRDFLETGVRVIGLAGWSGSGKTTLMRRLIPALRARGLTVSTVKHAHHDFDIDRPGKDSYEHRAAGASEVLVSSANRFALMREHRGDPEWTLAQLLAKLSPVDLVIVEGFKRQPHVKIEVWRAAVGMPPLAKDDPQIRAVASTDPLEGLPGETLDLDDVEAIAAAMLRFAEPLDAAIARCEGRAA